jgi:hypothetical protein
VFLFIETFLKSQRVNGVRRGTSPRFGWDGITELGIKMALLKQQGH